MKYSLVAAALIAASFAPFASAQFTLNPVFDTYLSNDNQNSSSHATVAHDTETSIALRNEAGSRFRLPVFQFDLSSLPGEVSGASFNFSFTAAQNNTRAITLFGIVDSAAEIALPSGTSYDDVWFMQQPSDGGPAYIAGNWQFSGGTLNTFASPNLVALGTFNNPSNSLGAKGFSGVTLDAFLNADTNNTVTFVIGVASATTGAPQAGIYTIAASAPNSTTLTGNAIPEPSTYALICGIGTLALVIIRRRLRR